MQSIEVKSKMNKEKITIRLENLIKAYKNLGTQYAGEAKRCKIGTWSDGFHEGRSTGFYQAMEEFEKLLEMVNEKK